MAQASTTNIICEASLAPETTNWYGKLVISKISHTDGSPVMIEKDLQLTFKSPEVLQEITFLTAPFLETTTRYTVQPSDDSTVIVTASISYPERHIIDPTSETVIIGINGDLLGEPEKYLKSVELSLNGHETPDKFGTVQFQCPDLPADLKSLIGSQQKVDFLQGTKVQLSVTMVPGTATSFQVPVGSYKVVPTDISTPRDLEQPADGGVIRPSTVHTEAEQPDIGVKLGEVSKVNLLDYKITSFTGLTYILTTTDIKWPVFTTHRILIEQPRGMPNRFREERPRFPLNQILYFDSLPNGKVEIQTHADEYPVQYSKSMINLTIIDAENLPFTIALTDKDLERIIDDL